MNQQNKTERWEEKEQLRVLSKCSPELIAIVGKHSTLWNYSKLETIEKISQLLSDARREEREKCLECRPKLETITRENFDYAKQEWNNALEAWTERIECIANQLPKDK